MSSSLLTSGIGSDVVCLSPDIVIVEFSEGKDRKNQQRLSAFWPKRCTVRPSRESTSTLLPLVVLLHDGSAGRASIRPLQSLPSLVDNNISMSGLESERIELAHEIMLNIFR